MPGSIPRSVSSARNLLSAVLASVAMIGATACGDDNGTGPANVEGTYSLTTAGGATLPATFSNVLITLEVRSGSLVLEDGLFEASVLVEIDDSPETLTTDGTYDRNGSRIEFDGTDQDGDDVSIVGNLSGNTITITDPETSLQLVFRKD